MSQPACLKNRIFSIKLAKKVLIFLVFVLIFDFFLYPAPTLASTLNNSEIQSFSEEQGIIAEENQTEMDNFEITEIYTNQLPENNTWQVKWSSYVIMTAYTSEVSQCDGAPCITANGFNLCQHGIEDSIAANFLKYGTKVRIPELFGDRVFVVRDRMNPKYDERIDIWMKDKAEAKAFGVKTAKIEILE